MESAVSFAPLRPADFADFAGRGGAGQGLLFVGRGGAACFSAGRGRAGRPSLGSTQAVTLTTFFTDNFP